MVPRKGIEKVSGAPPMVKVLWDARLRGGKQYQQPSAAIKQVEEEEQQPQQLVKNELQTVKLTNAGLDMEKSMQIQSNIAYYSSGKVHFNLRFFFVRSIAIY